MKSVKMAIYIIIIGYCSAMYNIGGYIELKFCIRRDAAGSHVNKVFCKSSNTCINHMVTPIATWWPLPRT